MDLQYIKRRDEKSIKILKDNNFTVTITDKSSGETFKFVSNTSFERAMNTKGMIDILQEQLDHVNKHL